MKIVLIGFACSGKTTVGKLLAEQLNLPFCDTDELTERLQQKSIAEIFACGGEQEFRKAELAALSHIPQNAVVACGGGTVLCDGFASFAQNAKVVWLRVGFTTVRSRLGNTPRPLFDDLSETELADYVMRRNTVYARFSDFIIDTDLLTVTQVVKTIACNLGTK